MWNIDSFAVLLGTYLLGSIPFGWIFVKLKTGKDIRDVQSGRTGGTNAMRAAGLSIGFYTGLLDVLKGTASVSIAKSIAPEFFWLHVLAGIAAIVGHNYSIFLLQRNPTTGRWRLAGGAGGGTCFGGSIGLWPPSGLIILPIAALIFYFVGYASVATMSVGFLSMVIFAVGAYLGRFPWEYPMFGVIALALLLWALKRNIKALRAGTERLHGYRARKGKTA